MNIYEIEIDEFELLVEIVKEYEDSQEFKIIGLYDGDLETPLDYETYNMIMADNEDGIIEDITGQMENQRIDQAFDFIEMEGGY